MYIFMVAVGAQDTICWIGIYKRQFACGQPNFHLLNFGLAEDILDRTEYARQCVGSICFCQMLFFCMWTDDAIHRKSYAPIDRLCMSQIPETAIQWLSANVSRIGISIEYNIRIEQ